MTINRLDTTQIQFAVDFIEKMDLYFQPKISEKVDLYQYVEKIISLGFFFYVGTVEEIYALIGFYSNDRINRTGYISYLAVDDEHFSQGLGKLLLLEAGTKMKEEGMVRVFVETSAINIKARKFYIKNGFSIQSIYTDNFNCEKLKLIKEL